MSDDTTPPPECSQFHLAEYTSLHGEIRELNGEARTLERQALYATGAVWAWLAVNPTSVHDIAWYIPVLFSTGGATRAYLLTRAVNNIAAYLLELDDAFAARPTLLGWHTYRKKERVTAGVMRSGLAFWFLLVTLTIVLPTARLLL